MGLAHMSMRRAGVTAVILAVAATTLVVGARPAAAEPVHTVCNGLRYANADSFDAYGSVSITSFYDVWDMTCTDDACVNIPDQASFTEKLDAYVDEFGSSSWVVLDFEDLVVNAATSDAQAQRQVSTLLTFIGWAHDAYPNAEIGMYDYDWSSTYTDDDAIALRKQLYGDGGLDFFAPTMYQRWSDSATWDDSLEAAIVNDARVADKPSIAYVSPYIGGRTSSGLQTSDEWSRRLAAADTELDGAIVWTQNTASQTLDTSAQWVQDTVDYLQ